MKKAWIASVALAFALSTAALAQTQTQNSSNGTSSKVNQRNTSSTEGLQRKGGERVGTRGSEKMKDGVSRSGNSNLSPTSPSSAPGPGTNSKSASGAKASGGSSSGSGGDAAKSAEPGGKNSTLKKADRSTKPVQNASQAGSTRNGNVGNAGTKPVYTQGSTSEGSASVPSNGGAPGSRTKETRSVQPKSRAAMLPNADPNLQKATAAGQANTAKKTGANGNASQGASNNSLTDRGQKEGSYSDAAKRNRTAEGPSKDPLKTGPNGQQTGKKN